MYDRISPFYLALTLALDGWILALCRVKIHVEGARKGPDGHGISVREQPPLEL